MAVQVLLDCSIYQYQSMWWMIVENRVCSPAGFQGVVLKGLGFGNVPLYFFMLVD